MGVKEASSLRLVLTLAVAGLLSGFVLAGVYMATLPRIQRNQAEALRAAIFEVLPGSSGFTTFTGQDGGLDPHDGAEGEPPPEDPVYAGFDDAGHLVGWAVPGDGPGFMDTIGLIYGYDPRERTIIGMAVLESRETPGLGDKILADPGFHENFVALAVEPTIEAVKKGEKTAANQVDCITGATISSEAVVGILNQSAERWVPVLPTDVPGAPAAAPAATEEGGESP